MSFPVHAKADWCGNFVEECVPYIKLFIFWRLDGSHAALFLGEDLAVLGITLLRSINLDYDANEVNNIVIRIS